MVWLHLFSYFVGGAMLANAVPHFVHGVSGRPFQSPFASPPAKGLSSSRVNVLWGAFNLLVAYLLLAKVGEFDIREGAQAAAFGLGVLVGGLGLAQIFAPLHGGNDPGAARR